MNITNIVAPIINDLGFCWVSAALAALHKSPEQQYVHLDGVSEHAETSFRPILVEHSPEFMQPLVYRFTTMALLTTSV